MTLYTTTMDIADTLESIEGSRNQKEAIDSYFSINNALTKFFQWYCSHDYSKIKEKFEYENNLKSPNKLVTVLPELFGLEKYSEDIQIRQISRVLSKIDKKNMMLLENCFDKAIRQYYPEINWDYINEKYNFEI